MFVPTRPYQLFFEHRPGYLYAYVHSDRVTYEIARGYWVEMLTMLHRRKYKRILFEKDVAQKLAPHEVFDLVSNLAHSGCCDISFAIFDHYYDPVRSRFEQMVGTNRGLNLRIGNDRPELERWLVSQPEQIGEKHKIALTAAAHAPTWVDRPGF